MQASCKDELNVGPWLTCYGATWEGGLAALTGACVSSGPSHAPMQQQSGQLQSAVPSGSLGLPASSYGGSASASGYSHAVPSSQGSMIQGPGPGYGSSSSSSSTSSSSSSSSRSNLNMQSNQGEPGIEEPNHQELVCFMWRNIFRLKKWTQRNNEGLTFMNHTLNMQYVSCMEKDLEGNERNAFQVFAVRCKQKYENSWMISEISLNVFMTNAPLILLESLAHVHICTHQSVNSLLVQWNHQANTFSSSERCPASSLLPSAPGFTPPNLWPLTLRCSPPPPGCPCVFTVPLFMHWLHWLCLHLCFRAASWNHLL